MQGCWKALSSYEPWSESALPVSEPWQGMEEEKIKNVNNENLLSNKQNLKKPYLTFPQSINYFLVSITSFQLS